MNIENSIQRITKRMSNGVYVFDSQPTIDGYIASLLFFQDYPSNELREQTTIREIECESYEKSVEMMYQFMREEKVRGFIGYNLLINLGDK